MAYGAVTRNLVKQVADLKREVELARKPFASVVDAHDDWQRGRISKTQFCNEVRAIIANSRAVFPEKAMDN